MAKQMNSVYELAEAVSRDAALAEEIKADPAAAIGKLAGPLLRDVWIYRLVVLGLVMAILIALGGSITLTAFGKTTPDLLLAIGTGALGALAGLLAPSPRQ